MSDVAVSTRPWIGRALPRAEDRRFVTGEAKYAGGYISIPFVWKNLGTDAPVLPPNGKVTAVFQAESLDIKKLFQDIGLKPAASGTLNVKFNASGTLADLNARLDLQMRNLKSENLPKFEPASFDLSAQARGKQAVELTRRDKRAVKALDRKPSTARPRTQPKHAGVRGIFVAAHKDLAKKTRS